MQKLLLAAAIILGLFFAWVDSRPNWDDTGVLVGAIMLSSAALGALSRQRPWLWAMAIGAPMPIYSFYATHQPPASAVALLFAFAGAYAGAIFRKLTAAPA